MSEPIPSARISFEEAFFAKLAADWRCETCGVQPLPGHLKVRRVDERVVVECPSCAPKVEDARPRTQAALFVQFDEANELPPDEARPDPRRYERTKGRLRE